MTNTQSFAKRELDILAATVPDAIIIPFQKEILALCEAFGKSGQSGGSAPYTATAISKAIKTLMLHEPLCDITGHDSEWINQTDISDGEVWFQNKRCSAVFKNEDNRPYYLDAIVWKGEEDWDTFTGRVYVDNVNFELMASRQYIKLPFKPKTFYIDVIRVPITKIEAEAKGLHYIEDQDGDCYCSFVKDPKQLNSVFKYYEKLECK